MWVASGSDGSEAQEGPASWRNQLSLRLARALAVLYLVVIVVLCLAMEGRWARITMVSAATLGCILAAVPAVFGRPSGRLRAWLVTVPAVIASLAGYTVVGFISGPATLLTLTIMVAGLLLGRRVMLSLTLTAALFLCAIAWAMTRALLPVPSPENVSMVRGAHWLRTIVITFFSIGLLGSLLTELVGRLEQSLEQARGESRRREEAERAKARTEVLSLEAKQLEAIGRLASGVAHDFNNNLTAIMGCAELLREEYSASPSGTELIDDILKSSRRAAELSGQLLAYSRKAQMVLVPTDVHRLLQNAVALLQRSMDPSVQVVTRLHADNANVLADSTLLDNAVLNLLVNAHDAMPNGGRLTVATSNYRVVESAPNGAHGLQPGTYVLVEVLDTGTGIESEILPHIFDPFFTTKPVGKGTGLGLAAVSGTIKAHHGSIEVESELGCGTAFRVFLPCSAAQSKSVRPEATAVTRGSGEVLLVEDDALVRGTAATVLRNLGYEVTTAVDGVQGIELLEGASTRFQLVILDLRMPRLSGEATFDEMRRLAPELPILIWSGNGAEQEVANLLRKGAAGFIQKPYRIAELSVFVHQAIHGRTDRV